MIKPSRKVVQRNEIPPFIPSPRFASESPAHQWTPGQMSTTPPSTGATASDQRGSRARSSAASRQALLSPVPPPPANLFDNGNTGSFNVDPGVPFLATAGPTEASSVRDSTEETTSEGRFVGGFVTGLKRAVTLRKSRSRKEAQNLRDLEEGMGPTMSLPSIRDSGYAPSPAEVAPPPTRVLDSPIMESPSRSIPSSRHTLPARSPSDAPPSEPDHGRESVDEMHDLEAGDVPPRTPHMSQQQSVLMSPVAMGSPVSAQLEYGSEYANNNPLSPPRTDISFNTYLARFQKLVQDVSNLPWVANERVTADYYPELQKRREGPYPPAITWQGIGQSRVGYQLAFDAVAADASDASSLSSRLHAPKRGSYGDVDLGEEFTDRSRGAGPDPPPGLAGHIQPPLPTTSHAPPPVYPPPNPLAPPPVNTVIITTPATNQWGPPPVSTWPPQNTTTTYTIPTPFAPPPGPARTTTTPSTRRKSRFSLRSKSSAGELAAHTDPAHNATSNSIPVVPNPEVWDDYPRYMTGYRPYEFTEHYYGTQYGTGVHNARPPVQGVGGGVSSVPSMMSMRQSQPVYPGVGGDNA